MEQRLFEQDFDFEIFYTDNTVFLGSDVLLEEYEIIDVFKICYEVFPRAKLYRLVIQPMVQKKHIFMSSRQMIWDNMLKGEYPRKKLFKP